MSIEDKNPEITKSISDNSVEKFESDKGESVRLEITENQDSAGPALARILDTEYDEFD